MSVGVIPVEQVRDALEAAEVDLLVLAERLGVAKEVVNRTLGLRVDQHGAVRQKLTPKVATRYLTAAGLPVELERIVGIPADRCADCRTELLAPSPTTNGRCRFCAMGMVA